MKLPVVRLREFVRATENGRVVALDFGGRYTGVAITDRSQQRAYAAGTLKTPAPGEFHAALFQLVARYLRRPQMTPAQYDQVVSGYAVGQPLDLMGRKALQARAQLHYMQQTRVEWRHILMVDERYTSQLVKKQSGSPNEYARVKDEQAAVLLLETYLASRTRL